MLVLELRAADARQHISQLSVLIDDLLQSAGFTYTDLDALAVSRGPGSYTGLRVGYATAKGLCLGLDIPLIEVGTLHSIAWGMRQNTLSKVDLYVPMIDARRMEVYSAFYDKNLFEVRPPHAWVLDEKDLRSLIDRYKTVAFGGNAAFKVAKTGLEVINDNNLVISSIECNSAYLIHPAWEIYQSGHFANTAYCEPAYLKPPNITKPQVQGT
jgi:tRNA threonylcarbamoyladenosine biosynthesis protein TsaB